MNLRSNEGHGMAHTRKERRNQNTALESSVSKGFRHSILDSDMWLLSMSCDYDESNQSPNKDRGPRMHVFIYLCIMKQE